MAELLSWRCTPEGATQYRIRPQQLQVLCVGERGERVIIFIDNGRTVGRVDLDAAAARQIVSRRVV